MASALPAASSVIDGAVTNARFVVELCVEDFEALGNLESNGEQARPSVSVQKKPRPTGGKPGLLGS